MTITFNSLSGRLLISGSFSEVLSCFVLKYISASSFCLTLCFSVLNRLAASPSLGGVALCRRCPLGPRCAVSPWSPEPGTPGISRVWAVCALLIWLGWDCYSILVGRTSPGASGWEAQSQPFRACCWVKLTPSPPQQELLWGAIILSWAACRCSWAGTTLDGYLPKYALGQGWSMGRGNTKWGKWW